MYHVSLACVLVFSDLCPLPLHLWTNMGVTRSSISASRAEILESKHQRGKTYYLFDCIY